MQNDILRCMDDRKMLKGSILIIMAFCVAWLPFAIVSLLGVFGRGDLIGPYIQLIPGMFAKMSPVYNPIIYSRGHPEVQKFVWRLRRKEQYSSKDHVQMLPIVAKATSENDLMDI